MYTSTYSSSSPLRTSTLGVGSTNYQHQPSNKINYNSYQIMDDGNTSVRRTPYSNTGSTLTSIPIHTTSSSKKYSSNYNNDDNLTNNFNTNKYQSTSYRSYAGDNEVFRSNNPTGNYRSQSYNDLVNDPNPSYRSQPSAYNSTSRIASNIDLYEQQPPRIRSDDSDGDLIVKSTDLSASNEQEMIELVRLAFRKYDLNNQRELAGFLKRSADRAFSSCWHCIVGRQFSSYVTHEMNGFIYLTKGPISILLFKSGS
jgi:dynein light chain LC8-type